MTDSKKMAATPQPTALTLHSKSRVLEITFDDGAEYALPFELLRVYSPSAEVRGHGPGQEVLQTGKRHTGITALDPVGHYAVQPTCSDGHATGIYSWDYLYHLGANQQPLWADYMARLHDAGFALDTGREPSAILPVAASGGCGHKH